MQFSINKRHINRTDEELIGDNADYMARFEFDDEWNGKIKTARFINGNNMVDVLLDENDMCQIPLEIVKQGILTIGVFSNKMTTTMSKVRVEPSIKSSKGKVPEPEYDVYAEIIKRLAELSDGSTGNVSIEQINNTVQAYYEEHKEELKGADGKNGIDGVDGKDGINGIDGKDGINGITPHIGKNGNWYIGEIDTNIRAEISDNEIEGKVNAYLGESGINKKLETGMFIADITPTFEKGGFYYSNNILTETTYMTYAKCGFMDIGLYKTISIKLNNNLYTYRIVQYDREDGTATSYRDYSEGSYCAENLDLTLSKRYIRIILKKADGTNVDLTEIQTVLTITMENATQIKTEVLSKSENPLYKASAYYDGDSICYGENSSGNSYPDIIAERNEMYLTKKAVSGTTIAIRDGYTNSILERVKAMTDDYDYVVLEGGYNDCAQGVTLGTITTGYQTDVDESTFIGAMESICKFLCTNYFEKKKLFIVPHRTLNTEVNSYYDSAITVCKKWGIPTIDLRDECNLIPFIGETVQTQYFEGANTGVHPTEQGYRVFYVPKIEGRMKTL